MWCIMQKRFAKFFKKQPKQLKEGQYKVRGRRVVCPDCGSEEFYQGPSGGMSINIKCAKCESEFNYTYGLGILDRI